MQLSICGNGLPGGQTGMLRFKAMGSSANRRRKANVGEFGEKLGAQAVGSFVWIFLKVKHALELHGKPTKRRLQVSTSRFLG